MEAYVYEAYGPPEVLKLREVDRPLPAKGEVLIRVLGISLNPADWRRMRGDPFLFRLASGLTKPRAGILGSDVSGRVEMLGPGVTQFQPGDELFGEIATGGFAGYACAAAEKFAPKPANLSFAEAAAVPLAANTALQALRDKAGLQPGQRVLVNGASGGVGTFAVQIARALGGEVTGICSTRNVELVQSLGAQHVIDYTRTDAFSSGQTYDVILDVVGNLTLDGYRRLLAEQGRGVIIGFKSVTGLLKVIIQAPLLLRNGRRVIPMNAIANQTDLIVLKEMIEEGAVSPVIDRRYPFKEIPLALEYLETGRARGKVVISTE